MFVNSVLGRVSPIVLYPGRLALGFKEPFNRETVLRNWA